MKMNNLILATDSYKVSHWSAFPPEVTGLYSYISSRGGRFPATLLFSIQMCIKDYLSKPITESDIQEAKAFMELHGEPFNWAGWRRILNVYGGYLPITIYAVPEGTLVPVGVPMVSVSCTDPKLYWLASYVETWLLRAVW